jgi:2-dehydro-3-deoxyphosphooctonate aldolase (KDO 8-P synthase)
LEINKNTMLNLARLTHTTSGHFFLIAGPCVIENETMPLEIAKTIKGLCDQLEIPFIFKASYRKANRSRIDSFTGIGDQKGLEIIRDVGEKLAIPVLTDIHTAIEAEVAAEYVDILQIPAFLCRQTDILVAAAKTGKYVNIKKGQFLSPGAMRFTVDKVRASGNNNIILTERGTTFGYQDLIVDFRGFPTMQQMDLPVVLDCTHSLQQPNQAKGVTGGQPLLIETIARAGIAVGADGLFIETHPEPQKALSDGANMLPLNQLGKLLEKLVKIHNAIQ